MRLAAGGCTLTADVQPRHSGWTTTVGTLWSDRWKESP
jgi:hypothetical protein